MNATIHAETLRADMARKKKTTPHSDAPKRVQVTCTGFEKELTEACALTDREEHELARIALRAVVAMILREKKLVTPLWLQMGEPPRETEV